MNPSPKDLQNQLLLESATVPDPDLPHQEPEQGEGGAGLQACIQAPCEGVPSGPEVNQELSLDRSHRKSDHTEGGAGLQTCMQAPCEGGPLGPEVTETKSDDQNANQEHADDEHEEDSKPPLAAYRGRTIALLRRYFRMSIDIGRLPSILGREFFRAKVTSYRVTSFEDVVIFVHDMERCLAKLHPTTQQLVSRIVFQNYDYAEAANFFGCTWRTIANRFPAAIDDLTQVLLDLKLMDAFPCQEGKKREKPASKTKQRK